MFDWNTVQKIHLPKTMKQLADEIGLTATVILIKEYRGRRLYVPDRVKESHILFSLLGKESFEKLSYTHGGCFLTIPICVKIFKVDRNLSIKDDRNTLTISQLAKKYELTRTCIHNILRVS